MAAWLTALLNARPVTDTRAFGWQASILGSNVPVSYLYRDYHFVVRDNHGGIREYQQSSSKLVQMYRYHTSIDYHFLVTTMEE